MLDDEFVAHRFRLACESGSAAGLSLLLDPDVTAFFDSGGTLPRAARPICGIAETTTAVLDLLVGAAISVQSVNGRAGLVVRCCDRVSAVASFSVCAGLVTEIWLVVNPDKLRHWN
ncbi:hypothetical protein LWC34_13160 [Kibdelosporangium philippinense]|uniref:Siderophore-interacting protein n=1 Tax=Kibdelosporangium philippinense TaxID=211113 RepID=A0ABS8ZB56_9PSEU|nr:hypothetical protein [Kibdelosporangium philippinense]MCE7003768.1 hypothetical protein [Kibdelosporangium philippinense]